MSEPTPRPGPRRPPSQEWVHRGPPPKSTNDEEYWAIVIGSGFGGAVTACRLAQALAKASPEKQKGKRILLLERGRRYYREDFPRLQLPDYLTLDPERVTSKRIPDMARMYWSNDQGLWEFRNLGELRVAQAAGLGGGSLVYCNVHLRPPNEVFDEKWPKQACPKHDCKCEFPENRFPEYSRDGLKHYYDRVAAMLEVDPLPEQERGQYPKVRAMRDVADSLTPDVARPNVHEAAQPPMMFPPLAVRFQGTATRLDDNGNNRFGRPQGDCTGCGNCTIGCQEGAKNTLDLNYLALAEHLGVEVRTLCQAKYLEYGENYVRIPYIDYLRSGTELAFRAEHVFLCAGAVGSTELLLRSREKARENRPDGNAPGVSELPEETPQKQDRLGRGFFANGDNLAVVFDSRKPISPTLGPTITSTIVHHGETDEGTKHWFLLQDGGIPPTLVESLGFFRSPLWLGRNRYRSPGMVPGRSFLSQLSSPAEPIGTVDRLMDEINTRVARSLGDPEGVSRPRFRPTAALARALRVMVPDNLKPLMERAQSLDKIGRQELRRVTSRVIRLLDQRLTSRVWTIPFAPLRGVIATEESMVDLVARALSEQYPVLRHVFNQDRGIDLVIGLVRLLVLGAAPPTENSGVFLVMGPDQEGSLKLKEGYLRVRWEKVKNAPLYNEQERLLRDASAALGGELRTNPAWTVGQTPLTVHAQGGCAMAATADKGVVRPCGMHWQLNRVFVMDAAAFPGSVGVNPSATIAAVAERNIELFIRRELGLEPGEYVDWAPPDIRAPDPRRTDDGYRKMLEESLRRGLPPRVEGVPRSPPMGMEWEEEMVGFLVEGGSHLIDHVSEKAFDPATVDVRPFLSAEQRGTTSGLHVRAKLKVKIPDLGKFFLEDRPKMHLEGDITVLRSRRQKGESEKFKLGKGAALFFDLMKDPRRDTTRFWAGRRRLKGMSYEVPLEMPPLAGAGPRAMEAWGRKFIHDDPGIDVWADLSTLYVGCKYENRSYVGVLRISLTKFLTEQLRKMRMPSGKTGEPPVDELAQGWAFLRLAGYFMDSVKNAYSEWF